MQGADRVPARSDTQHPGRASHAVEPIMSFSNKKIATALAAPGRRVACFVGDGGLGMVLAELETLARLHVDVTVVVFDDATLTLIELKQGDGQGGRGAVGYRPVDFAGVASAMGVPGVAVTDVGGLRAALARPGAGPRLVDARIDPAAYPHVIRTIRG